MFCTQDQSDSEIEATQPRKFRKEEWLQQASSITCMCESFQRMILSTCRRNVFCTQDESDKEMELKEWRKEECMASASELDHVHV